MHNKLHGNIRYPELHDKEKLALLVDKYKFASHIASYLGCKRQAVDIALRKFKINRKQNNE